MVYVFSFSIRDFPCSLELRRRFRLTLGWVDDRHPLGELIISAFGGGTPPESEIRVVGVDGVEARDALAFNVAQHDKQIVLTYTADIAGSDAIVCVSAR